MKQITIIVPQEVTNELQRASMEATSRQGVIDRYLEKHMDDADSSAIEAKPFKHFMSLLAEAEAEFELAKEAITNTYVPDYLREHDVDWMLDYATNVLTITINCDCDIPELEKDFK